MNIVLVRIPQSHAEPSLLHPDIVSAPEPSKFYMDDIVAGSRSFEQLFEFLEQHILPRILWS